MIFELKSLPSPAKEEKSLPQQCLSLLLTHQRGLQRLLQKNLRHLYPSKHRKLLSLSP